MSNFIEYQKVCATTKRFLKSKARESWRHYCSNLNRNTPIRDVWKQAKIMRRSNNTRRKTANSNSWTEEFLASLTPDSVSAPLDNPEDVPSSKTSILSNEFTLTELEIAISSRQNSAPGLDEIKYPMIKNLPLNAKSYLLSIYNDIWVMGESPTTWNATSVVPILKPNQDPNIASSYRPISLLSCILKTFERLIKSILEWWFSTVHPLPHNSDLNSPTAQWMQFPNWLPIFKTISHLMNI